MSYYVYEWLALAVVAIVAEEEVAQSSGPFLTGVLAGFFCFVILALLVPAVIKKHRGKIVVKQCRVVRNNCYTM